MTPGRNDKAGSFSTLLALINEFSRAYPLRTTLTVAGLLAAGILEGASIMAFLPLVAMIDVGNTAEPNRAEAAFTSFLSLLGLSPGLGVFLAVFAGGIILKGLVLLWTTQQVGYSVANVTADLRRRFVSSLLSSSWGYFSSLAIGNLANTISNEAERSARAYESLCQLGALLIQTVIYLALAFLVSWRIAIAGVLAGAILILVLNRLIHLARRAGRSQTDLMQTMMSRITNSLFGMKSLKAMAREEQLGRFLEDVIMSLNTTARRAVVYRQALATMQEPIIVLFLASGVYVAFTIFDIPLSLQVVLAVIFFRLITRIGASQQHWQTAMMAESAFWSLKSNIDLAAQNKEQFKSGDIPVLPANITLQDLHFGYVDRKVLSGINLRLNLGEITAIIGPSGSGKTTLADMIVGLRTPDAGKVLIGGLDLRQIDLAEWRAAIGYVPQDTILFNETLLANVALEDSTITAEQAITALRQAGAWSFVEELPNGIDTYLGEEGLQLSGGQRQRVAIARALVRNPALLILDEATGALDPETEAEICRTISNLRNDRVILVITHRPAWVSIADHVHQLDNGKIITVPDDVRAMDEPASTTPSKSPAV